MLKKLLLATRLFEGGFTQRPSSRLDLRNVSVPCTKLGGPAGCDSSRFAPCNTTSYNVDNVIFLDKDTNHQCANKQSDLSQGENGDPYRARDQGKEFLVQFDGADGDCVEIIMKNGECWGDHPQTGDNYDCQGRCGGGCGSWSCSNWATDCLIHDVCSWYYGATDGLADRNCGDSYATAIDDTVSLCFWWRQQQCESRYHNREYSSAEWICGNP